MSHANSLVRLVREQSFQATFHTSQTYDNRHLVSFHGVRAAGRNEISGDVGEGGERRVGGGWDGTGVRILR